MLIPIDNPDDPRIDAFRQVRERDLVGRQGRFVAEGEVVLAAAVRSGRHPLEALLIDAKRVEALEPVLRGLADSVPVYTASQGVLDAIVGFHIHRGVLGIGRRGPQPSAAGLLASLEGHCAVLALFGIGNHDNMGGLFRNAAAFGAGAVLLGSDCCDPLYRKSIRVSVGAALTVPFARFAAGDDPLAILQAADFQPLALSPSGAERLIDLDPPARTAVLLGAEGPGLPSSLMDRARTVSIPMSARWDSLNVAVTGGIVLHHLTFARQIAPG